MLNIINKNQGLLTLISVVGWIIFSYTTAQADLDSIKKNYAKQFILMETISDSLKEKSRDHSEFQKSVDKTNETLDDMKYILIRLDSTIRNLNEKIAKMED